eukprot:scaffold173911_cov69-Cyclotella_meneghiniana.AAC.2
MVGLCVFQDLCSATLLHDSSRRLFVVLVVCGDGLVALAFHVDSKNSVALMFFCDDVDSSR